MNARTEIMVGPLASHAEALEEVAKGEPLFLVTDPHVWSLQGELVADLVDVVPHFVPRGEDAKSWQHLQALIGDLAAANHPRSRPIVALGGGSVGDLTGFAASIYRRGCPVIHIPTTLLAQVDSAVGGKTAIDAEGEKNLVGSFHLPAMVLADPAFLATLDRRQMRAGLAEVIKYGAIADPDFFAWVGAHGEAILSADANACTRAATHCIAAKQAIVESDLYDLGGKRALLNFGHTFGHAIESVAGLGKVLHGEAVAIGMMLATRLSERLGIAEPGSIELMADMLGRTGLPSRLSDAGLGGRGEELLPYMLRDKKNRDARVMLILLKRIGEAFATDEIEAETLASFLRDAG
ncbi:3-dehydroquinate synthase [Sphingomicrobium clamense]|uniref:3-dehydroquinate synthase n=1 Tax=Sphingomicrobium clamense TaxID=2851013 RepID=A0ABS6V7G5_9SPHN|nr:3-dehydroquinate synthase [Sphingomicrobium sp. B8]MBW0145510.1 3-dehydroquinate synthase [Sphingomicrobium sp. B8]